MSVANLLTENLKSYLNLHVASLQLGDGAPMNDFDEISGTFKIDQYASGIGIVYSAIKINGFVYMAINSANVPFSKISADVDDLQSQDFTGWKQSFNCEVSSSSLIITYNGPTEADGRQIGHVFIHAGDMTLPGQMLFYRGPQITGNQWLTAPAGGSWAHRAIISYKAV